MQESPCHKNKVGFTAYFAIDLQILSVLRCDNGDSKLLHKLVNESIAAHGLVNILEWPSLQTGRHSWFVFPVFRFGSQYQ